MDGMLFEENLQDARLDRKWLDTELKAQDIHDISEVFYAGVDDANTLYVSKKRHRTEKHGQYGIE